MIKFLNLALIFFLVCICTSVMAENTSDILHDLCINRLYEPANKIFANTDIEVIRDSRGIILRFYFENPIQEYKKLSAKTLYNIEKIEYFLAKIKNPVIIEVHIGEFLNGEKEELKRWEISTVIANNIELEILKNLSNADISEINSIGYGEFLPVKNTPNNGGKYINRVDIIILCNVIGE